jgi:hypothetical protein
MRITLGFSGFISTYEVFLPDVDQSHRLWRIDRLKRD